jgi:hypothetical protein
MKVSRNEMNTALKRAYEGAGYDIGDYEDAGDFITWSEMCGFEVVSNLQIPPLGPKGSATPRLVYEGNNNAVIDAGGADTCQYGSLASHLACSKANGENLVTLHLENCLNPTLILPSLALIAKRGVYVCVYWRDQHGAHGASFEAGAMFPNYWCVTPNPTITFIGTSTITLLCTREAGLLADAVIRQTEQAGVLRFEKSNVQLADNYDQALEHGIDVDEAQWQALNAAAWPILVSTTTQSRLGAGPGQR